MSSYKVWYIYAPNWMNYSHFCGPLTFYLAYYNISSRNILKDAKLRD